MDIIAYSGLFLLIFAQYLTTAIPAYLVLMVGLLASPNIKLPPRMMLYVIAVICYWLAVLSYGIGRNLATHLLFYFGFLIPYIVLSSNKRVKRDFFISEKILIGLCVSIIVEAILFNSPVARYLYFFPVDGSENRVALFGFYQRPTGVAGNASMTAGVLFFLSVLVERVRGALKIGTQFLVLASTILLASGTGFGLLLLYLVISVFRSGRLNKRTLAQGLFYLMILAFSIAFASGYFGEFDQFDKFSANYFVLMYDYKMAVVEEIFRNASIQLVLFGHQIIPDFTATSGDSGFIIAPYAIGLIGAGLLFVAPLLFPAGVRRNILPTLFFYAAFIHYPGLLTPPGQVLIGCYLCLLARDTREAPFRTGPPKKLSLAEA